MLARSLSVKKLEIIMSSNQSQTIQGQFHLEPSFNAQSYDLCMRSKPPFQKTSQTNIKLETPPSTNTLVPRQWPEGVQINCTACRYFAKSAASQVRAPAPCFTCFEQNSKKAFFFFVLLPLWQKISGRPWLNLFVFWLLGAEFVFKQTFLL